MTTLTTAMIMRTMMATLMLIVTVKKKGCIFTFFVFGDFGPPYRIGSDSAVPHSLGERRKTMFGSFALAKYRKNLTFFERFSIHSRKRVLGPKLALMAFWGLKK
jgi:hypothetical protein